MRVGVIGAGPAGMMAAWQAAKHGTRVVLFDSNARPGKKLLITGSGRCNLSNTKCAPERYTCDESDFLSRAWAEFSQADLVNLLGELGIPLYATDDGWYYPLSNSAANVAEILIELLVAAGVEFVPESRVVQISPAGYGFKVYCENEEKPVYVDSLVVASGGKAYPQTGSDGSLFPIIRGLGHRILPTRPALAPVLLEGGTTSLLKGVRLDAGCMLVKNEKVVESTVGNVIFTEWGMNGPGVMDLSHWIEKPEQEDYRLVVNFLPGKESLLFDFLQQGAQNGLSPRAVLLGLLPEKVVSWAMDGLDIEPNQLAGDLSPEQANTLARKLTSTSLKVLGVKGYSHAQCSTGGVAVSEVNGSTMESKIVPGIFFAGEVLNVNGPCGGYNLHWALTSGWIAGRGAALRGKMSSLD